ncbi:hypothetical protein [Streptomyces sp. NPDC127084]|uniref:hypothetical protein n=1 Tax=Streptomyces sp. NPDC127084 TaxID=3347133 RepID=UPI003656280A
MSDTGPACPNDTICEATVTCPDVGQVVTGGGGAIDPSGQAQATNVSIQTSFPSADNEWTVFAENDSDTTITYVAWAVCATVA